MNFKVLKKLISNISLEAGTFVPFMSKEEVVGNFTSFSSFVNVSILLIENNLNVR